MDFAGFYLEPWMAWAIAIVCYVLAGCLTAKFCISNDADLKSAENYSKLTESQKGTIVGLVFAGIFIWPLMLSLIIILIIALPKKFR